MIFDNVRDKYPLFSATANYLESKCYFFRSTLNDIKMIGLDYDLAEKLCNACYDHCGRIDETYFQKVGALIEFSVEFLRLQMHLNKTGKYLYSTHDEVIKYVYDNSERELKGPWYMWALYFSQIFWVTHWRVLKFFLTEFVPSVKDEGVVLEVPTGTGIFITQFLLNKPRWKGVGVDLGETSIQFTKDVLSWNNIGVDRVNLIHDDIYNYNEDHKYDCIMCGEFLEHVEDPLKILKRLAYLLDSGGKIFLTVAVYASMIDHIYLYNSADDVRSHINEAGLVVEKEFVQAVFKNVDPESRNTPVNYCAVLGK